MESEFSFWYRNCTQMVCQVQGEQTILFQDREEGEEEREEEGKWVEERMSGVLSDVILVFNILIFALHAFNVFIKLCQIQINNFYKKKKNLIDDLHSPCLFAIF